jgi:hypothetical protein
MSKKNKTGRGKAMTLAEFAGPSEGNLDWAQDEFAPTPPAGPAEAGQEVPGMDGDGKKRGTDWRNFGFKAGAMTGNFREEAPVQNTKIVPEDMQAPFVAFVGNLPHNIAADLVSESFDDVIDSRVIKHGNSTFSYVEFETRTALQNAILLTGKIIGGRKIRVDVASDQQRNRLEQERNGGSNNASGRESAMIGRDAMGSAQPNMSPGPGGRGGSRMGSRNASAMDLNREFTRDSMGAAQPTTGADTPTTGGGGDFSREAFGESKPRTPNSGGRAFGGNFRDRQSKPASPVSTGGPRFGEAPDFSAWRESAPMAQPESPAGNGAPTFARRKGPRDGPKDGDDAEVKDMTEEQQQKKDTQTEEQKAPVPERNWRDTPAEKQPTQSSWREQAPAAKQQSPAPAGASWRDAPARDGATRDAPAATTEKAKQPPAPAAPAKTLATKTTAGATAAPAEGGGSWRENAPAKPAVSSVNSWRQGPPPAVAAK